MSLDDVESSSYGARPLQLFIFSTRSKTMPMVGGSSRPYTWNNLDFMPDAFIELGEVNQSLSESSPSVEIPVEASSEVAQMFIPYLPAEPIQIRVLRLNIVDGAEDYAAEFIGEVVSSAFDDTTGVCTLIARMTAASMSRPVPWCVYSSNCALMLGGVGCGVNLNAYRTQGALASGQGGTVLSVAEFTTAASDHGVTDPEVAEQWFRLGYVRHIDSGEVRMVVDHVGANVTVQTPFVFAKNGDQMEGFAGCDHTENHCGPKFDNLNNMLAFPDIPGRNPYTQSVYGNEAGNGTQGAT